MKNLETIVTCLVALTILVVFVYTTASSSIIDFSNNVFMRGYAKE